MTWAVAWSNDRVEQLKKLWEAGLSASQIACELGNVTRNAVIGKVHRLGLTGRAKLPSSAPRRPRQPRDCIVRVRHVARGSTALAEAFAVEDEPVLAIADNVIPFSQRLSLLDLNEAVCHWPVGDPMEPDFFFCGGKAYGGGSYCIHHARTAYQPPSARTRREPKLPTNMAGAKVIKR